MNSKQLERLSTINKSVSVIAEALSEIKIPDHIARFLANEIKDIHTLLRVAEGQILSDPELSREQLLYIGKIFGRMDSVHYIIMSSIKKNLRK